MKKYKQQDISSGVIKCSSCSEVKSLGNYYLSKGYYDYTCKECYKKKHKNRYIKVDKVKVFDFIVCNKCGDKKPVDDYLKSKNGYYVKRCKGCRCTKSTKITPKRNDGYKTCCKCKLDLPLTEYYHDKGKPKGACKKCRVEINKVNNKKWRNTKQGKLKFKENKRRYRDKLKELKRPENEEKKREKELLIIQKEQRRVEREKEKEKRKELKSQKKKDYEKLIEYRNSDEWKEITKQKYRETRNKRFKMRWGNDELFSIRVRIRNLVRNTFRKSGHTKPEKRTEGILGCSYEELKNHLESQFVEGMSWDNRGDWHIDHIIPLSSAVDKEGLLKLSHYTNLQPLWEKDNLEKSNKIL